MFPVLLLINIQNVIRSISTIVKIKKPKKYSSDHETFDSLGHNVNTELNLYSEWNYLDKESIAIKVLNIICEKYTTIADLYYKINNYENALKYYILAMEKRRRTGKDKNYFGDDNIIFNQKIGMVYFKLNDYHNTLKYCKKALKFYISMTKFYNQFMHDEIKRNKNDNEEQENENIIVNDLYNTNIAELFNILGQVYFIQKKYQKSLEYFMKAIEIHELLPCEDIDEDTGNSKDNINYRSYNAMITIYINIGKTYKEIGKFDKALMNYNKALEYFFYDKNEENSWINEITDEIIELLDNDAEGRLSHLDTIMLYYGANVVCVKINKFDKAFNVNITINSDKNDDLAKLHAFAGNVYMKLNDQNKANELYEKALLSYNNEIKNSSGKDYEEQLKILKEKLAIEIKRYDNENIDIAKTYYSIGLIYKSLNKPEKRLEYYKKGLEIQIKEQGEEHADTATQYNNVAVAYNCIGDSERALEYHNKAVSIRLKNYGEEHKDTALSYANIGYVYRDLNNYEKALEYFEKALKIYKKVTPKDFKKQIELYEQIIEMQIKIYGDVHAKIAASQNDLGNIYFNSGNIDMALDYALNSLKIRLKVFGEDHSLTALSYNNIGVTHCILKQYEKALENHNKALEIRKKIYGEENTDTAMSYFNIGNVYKNNKNYEKALDYYKKALEIREILFPIGDQKIKIVQDNIKELTNKLNNT